MEKNVLEEVWGIDRTQWGRWKLDGGHLVYHGAPEHPGLDYHIDTAQLATPAKVWNWVCQLEEKTWCTEQDLGHFVRAAIAIMKHIGVLGDVPVPPTLMSPWHPDWAEFLQQLAEEIGLTRTEEDGDYAENCGHDPECPKAVGILQKLKFDGVAVERSLVYFRQHKGKCDCRIALHVESDAAKSSMRPGSSGDVTETHS